MKTEEEYNNLTGNIIHAATEVHRQLGPGLLESVYEICLEKELMLRNMKVERQKRLPVIYKGYTLDKDFIIDLLVEDEIVIREGIRNNIPWESTQYIFSGEAPDGEIALSMIGEVKPDILVADIKMPFMDGLTLARIVKKTFPWIKIIRLASWLPEPVP